MKKWDKLNKEFDEVLNKLTTEDWQKWDNSRTDNKAKKRESLLIKSFVQQNYMLLNCVEIIEPEPHFEYYYDDYIQKELEEKKRKGLEKTRGHFFYVKSQYELINRAGCF